MANTSSAVVFVALNCLRPFSFRQATIVSEWKATRTRAWAAGIFARFAAIPFGSRRARQSLRYEGAAHSNMLEKYLCCESILIRLNKRFDSVVFYRWENGTFCVCGWMRGVGRNGVRYEWATCQSYLMFQLRPFRPRSMEAMEELGLENVQCYSG